MRVENGGTLPPEMVLERATPVSHPLHECFEWDDSKASHEYRLWQARQLIRVSVSVVHPELSPTRTYVSLVGDRRNGTGYRSTVDCARDPVLREQMLDEALRYMQVFERKYGILSELATVFTEVKRVRRSRKREGVTA